MEYDHRWDAVAAVDDDALDDEHDVLLQLDDSLDVTHKHSGNDKDGHHCNFSYSDYASMPTFEDYSAS